MKETERIKILDDLVAKRIKQKHASLQLGISIRQVQRMIKRFKHEGIKGLIHKSRGKIGNRAMSTEVKNKILFLIKKHYFDFGPTLASENLFDRHGIRVSSEKVRSLMSGEGLWKIHSRKNIKIHTYRERRSCVGELIQLDGSPHKWFEDRAAPCTLIAYIDDATSRIMDGGFADYEGTFTLFETTKHYLKTYGKPLSFYMDKHSTYKINRQATIEEELRDSQPLSQFARAIQELRIEFIFANSPQAKGRIERLFETLQDRLVKELRLEGISTKSQATKYFREVYIPRHNAKFAVQPKDSTDVHRRLLPSDDLIRIFTVQTKRVVSRALVVQYKNTKYQLDTTGAYRYLLRQQNIVVEENRDGAIIFRYKGKPVTYMIITEAVKQHNFIQVASTKSFKEKRVVIPGRDHPWRQRIIPAI